jgi:hypothetical protein
MLGARLGQLAVGLQCCLGFLDCALIGIVWAHSRFASQVMALVVMKETQPRARR